MMRTKSRAALRNNRSSLLASEQAGNFKIVFESPFAYSLYGVGNDTGIEYDESYIPGEEADDEILQAINSALRKDRASLEEVVEVAPEELGMVSINFALVNDKLHTAVVTDHELDDDEIDDLADFVTGQLSDGYGESFEQYSVASVECMWDVEEDEDEGIEEGRETADMEVYCHLWYSNSGGTRYCPKWDLVRIA